MSVFKLCRYNLRRYLKPDADPFIQAIRGADNSILTTRISEQQTPSSAATKASWVAAVYNEQVHQDSQKRSRQHVTTQQTFLSLKPPTSTGIPVALVASCHRGTLCTVPPIHGKNVCVSVVVLRSHPKRNPALLYLFLHDKAGGYSGFSIFKETFPATKPVDSVGCVRHE